MITFSQSRISKFGSGVETTVAGLMDFLSVLGGSGCLSLSFPWFVYRSHQVDLFGLRDKYEVHFATIDLAVAMTSYARSLE